MCVGVFVWMCLILLEYFGMKQGDSTRGSCAPFLSGSPRMSLRMARLFRLRSIVVGRARPICSLKMPQTPTDGQYRYMDQRAFTLSCPLPCTFYLGLLPACPPACWPACPPAPPGCRVFSSPQIRLRGGSRRRTRPRSRRNERYRSVSCFAATASTESTVHCTV